MEQQNIILVYEFVPDSTRIYHLVVDSETADRIQATHLRFMNTDSEDKSCNWLSEYLGDKTPIIHSESKSGTSPTLHVPESCSVVLTGFIC